MLTVGLLFAGVTVAYIPIIILAFVGVTGFLYVVIFKGKPAVIRLSRQEIVFAVFAIFIVLSLSIPFFMGGPNRLAIAGHVFHHSLMVTQIMNGIFPPENPGLGGTSIGYYWGFHSLVAALTARTNYHQIQIFFIVNVISLFIIFCISYNFSKIYKLPEIYRYIMPLAVLGLMRFDAGILFIWKLISGSLPPLQEIIARPVEPYEVLMSWLHNLPRFDTRLLFLRKIYNVSGMPLAVTLCLAYLLSLLLIIKGKSSKNIYYLIGIVLIITACFLNYPPLAIFLVLHAPIWFVFLLVSESGSLKAKIRESLTILIPYFLAILIVLPYMLFIITSRDISSADQGGILQLSFYEQSIINIVTFLVPLPVILYGIRGAFKELKLSRELLFLLIAAILCLGLTVIVRLPFNNSYKFSYLLTFLYALFFVYAVQELLSFVKSRPFRRLIIVGIILFLSMPALIVEASSIVSLFSTAQQYEFSDKHITYTQDPGKNEAYRWISENSQPDSLLMLSYIETNWPCCGLNNNYETAAVSERNLFVIKDEDYTVSNPEYKTRKRMREKLFKDPGDRQVVDYFTSLNRPVYLLVEEGLDKSKFLVEKRFEHFPSDPGKGFQLVFSNSKHRVYQIRLNR
jgi:hypothetical protein